jgi:hypothetical protein
VDGQEKLRCHHFRIRMTCGGRTGPCDAAGTVGVHRVHAVHSVFLTVDKWGGKNNSMGR